MVKGWLVCPIFGQISEPWLWRQAVGIERPALSIVCWGYKNREHYPLSEKPVYILDHPAAPRHRPERWIIAARNFLKGNFYGTVGREKRALARLMEQSKPDVALCQFGQCALRILPVARKMKVPLVAHFHGLDLSSTLVQDRWYRWSLLRSLPEFAAIVVVGEHQEKWMLDHGIPQEHLHLIPCGAPVSEYNAHSSRLSHKVRFIAVSRLVAWKGVDITIRAFAAVAAKLPETELLIVGDGQERGALEALSGSLGLKGRVSFAGGCSSEETRKHYESAHVFVQHSITHSSGWVEGFGVTIVEAAAAGLPVVVSRSGGIGPQVVHSETGFLIDERDVTGMAEAMMVLAQKPELRARMGMQGRKHVEEHFDSRKQIAKLENVLLKVAARGVSGKVQN